MAAVITVWDAGTDTLTEVTPAEAAAGLLRYAHSLGRGTPACAAWELRAAELGRAGKVEGFSTD